MILRLYLSLLFTTIFADVFASSGQQQQRFASTSVDPSGGLFVTSSDNCADGDDAQCIVTKQNISDIPTSDYNEVCESDKRTECSFWASLGECAKNPTYMHQNCRTSCDSCKYFPLDSKSVEGIADESCVDKYNNCASIVSNDKCRSPSGFAAQKCKSSCRLCRTEIFSLHAYSLGADMGVIQELGTPDIKPDVSKVLAEARNYMKNEAPKANEPPIMDLCTNQHKSCSKWAALGECDANPAYMKKNCGPACKSCEYSTIEGRCPIDPEAPKAWGPGDMGRMFARLSSEPFKSEYDVDVLSSPETGGPWAITMGNIISEEEAETLIQLGSIEGYERSSDVGERKADGSYGQSVNERRTSMNAWCTGECFNHEVSRNAMGKIANLTGIPETYSENLQMLRYEPGQFYQVHHDLIPHHIERQCGVRILTVYIYLNDVEEGGGTNFDKLGLTVTPKRGRVLLWPSVKDENPNEKDDRTTHQALPVIKGVKYGANAWYHQHDFKTPNRNGCT